MSLNYDIMRLVGERVKWRRNYEVAVMDMMWKMEHLCFRISGMTRNTEDDDNFGGQGGGRWWADEGTNDPVIDPRSAYLAWTLGKVNDTPDHLTNYSFQVELVESWNLMVSNIWEGDYGREQFICHKTLTFLEGEEFDSRFSAWGWYCPP